ncbi:UDP-2,3-diacylglucosamine diphosphatase [Parabacteroides bouchesdurhonensis]|uniref:UDP-2,3-diacylglucosamine diphosphatase n=1 Tax=Parabacteroides bouchesdurhonensis TaxID=1936995 RepID=UPI000E499E63|nr:UDP-2,3-diacylglucosamine diphosphatase [Parabacteroides bouchesdurhonensis]RHJ93450.1 UDP-2,3-diacylglucosamine diphosphatase [Bacteroides sp. AM07-16]
MELRTYYPTVVLSDIHLGSEHSRTEEVTTFLKHVDCKRLILNGDIIDGWQLRKAGKRWKQKHTDFFKVLMKMMEKKGTQIIYVRGNHDDFLDNLVPFQMSNISIVKDYLLESHGKRYFVTHGDIFDAVTTNMRWLAMLGDMGYTFLLWLNKVYNHYRAKKGKPYFSLSQKVKHKVKSAVSYISEFENELVKLANAKKLDGIICGHIHQAANSYYGNIHYLNSGDWVESLTALVENEDGEWNVITYDSLKYPLVETGKEEHLYAAVI